MRTNGTFDGMEEYKQTYCAQTTDSAPLFSAEAYENLKQKITKINLKDYRGKWVILFFYASDFTFV